MSIAFTDAFDRLLGHEGGYVDDPRDPGGETNWGVSKRSYPNVDIKGLTRAGAAAIYERDFWSPLGAIDSAVKFQVFDFAVNGGMPVAIKSLQTAVGVLADGKWGLQSAAAAAKMEVNDILLRFNAARLRYYTSLDKLWSTYGKGWTNRVADNLNYAAKDN